MRRAIIIRAYENEISLVENLPDDVDEATEIVESEMSNSDEFRFIEPKVKIQWYRYDGVTDTVEQNYEPIEI